MLHLLVLGLLAPMRSYSPPTKPALSPAIAKCHHLRGGALVASAPPPPPARSWLQPPETETSLRITAALLVLGVSLLVLRPTPALIEVVGERRATELLSLVASTSAATEIVASPIVGSLADAFGRRRALLGTLVVTLLSSVGCALSPSVSWILISKYVSSMAVGVFVLLASTILADSYRTEPKRLAGASSSLFAVVNLGFAVGVAVTSALPPGLRACYSCSAAALLGALGLAATSIRESLAPEQRVPFQLKAINPLACLRLFRSGPDLRALAMITALTIQPLFMGDVSQLHAMSQWGLDVKGVSQLFTAIAITGVASNLAAGKFIGRMGLKPFAMLATASSIIFHLGFCVSHKVALLGAFIGWLGPARAVSSSSMITAVGARAGMPQGQLSGDRANLVAILKVVGPLMYGQAYLAGKALGSPTLALPLPFMINVLLTVGALVLWARLDARVAEGTSKP